MFYKFMGGPVHALLDVFEKAVVEGSIRFASVLGFNDPFEFKFISVPPTRAEFDRWHGIYDPTRSEVELDNAWRSFYGPAADFNTSFWPRAQLLGNLYMLCLARRWNSHLMWAHYATEHRGFVVRYKPELIDALAALDDWKGGGDVTYSDQVPQMRWFSRSPSEMLKPVVSTKSPEWSYEAEHRVLMHGPAGARAIFQSVNPDLIAGVIFGARAPEALIQKATALRSSRHGFTVEQVSSRPGRFDLVARTVDPNVRSLADFL
jgi:hypothetical protein